MRTRTKASFLPLVGLLIVQLYLVGGVAAQNVLSITTASVFPGTSVSLSVGLASSQDLTALRFDVVFDVPLCSVIADKNGDGIITGVIVGADAGITADKDIVVKRTARVTEAPQEEVFLCGGEKIPVAVLSLGGGTVVPSGNGNIFTIEFSIKPALLSGTFPLIAANIQGRRGPSTLVIEAQPGGVNVILPECISDPDCTDGNACTQDRCVSGACEHLPVVCDDGIPCTKNSCDPVTGCVWTPDDSLCFDGNPCTQDICQVGAGCIHPPVPIACGNGCLESGEECDDGNIISGDGCSSTCQWEAACGNGRIDPGEECDDGNTADDDGCSSGCMVELGHFKCYDATVAAGTPGFEVRTVTLKDLFETKQTDVKGLADLCNPVRKNGEVVPDATAHLACYVIKTTKTKPAQTKFAKQNIRVQNQFGDQTLTLSAPKTLCVPSEKDGVASALHLDHFKCYPAKTAQGEPKFVRTNIILEDQFETRNMTVLKPVSLCAPVDKNGEGVRDAKSFLTCYDIKNVKGQARFEPENALVENQFGELTLTASKADMLCVPTILVDLGLINADQDSE